MRKDWLSGGGNANVAVRRLIRIGRSHPGLGSIGRWISPTIRWRVDGISARAISLNRVTRACLAIEVDTSLPAARVRRRLDRVVEVAGKPQSIRVDNGPEFGSAVLKGWAAEQQVELDLTTPGKPMEHGHIERFNGKFRDECVSQHWFISLADARRIIEQWRIDDNTVRPYRALANLTPRMVAQQHGVVPLPL